MRTRYAPDAPEGTAFDVPARNLVATLAPRRAPARDEDALFAAALEAPLDAPPLEARAANARRVLVIVDDATRATPVARILPHVARRLEAAGIEDDQVTLLTAQGTHRRMSEDELDAKLGAFRARWRVLQHDYLDEESLRSYGETRDGMPIVAHRLLQECDLRIGIGQVGVHGILGFSGGAKIVIPGIAGAESERCTHWRATGYEQASLMGQMENPIRATVEEAVRMTGLDAVFNVAMDSHGRVAHAAYGDLVTAQRDCARVSRDLNAASLPEQVDVVVAESAPADLEYWQSIKGLFAATLCVREGGVIVLATPSPEGVSSRHPELLELAGLSTDEIRGRVERGEVQDVIAAAVAHFTARIRERSDVILVSGGIGEKDARRLGFTAVPSMQAAIDEALARGGPDARVAVLREGGAILPVLPQAGSE